MNEKQSAPKVAESFHWHWKNAGLTINNSLMLMLIYINKERKTREALDCCPENQGTLNVQTRWMDHWNSAEHHKQA